MALQQIWEVEQKLIGAEVQIRTWKGTRSQAISLKDLRAVLRADQFVVEYVWGEERIYGMTISQNGARVIPLGRRAPVERLVGEYFELLQHSADDSEVTRVASSLSRDRGTAAVAGIQE